MATREIRRVGQAYTGSKPLPWRHQHCRKQTPAHTQSAGSTMATNTNGALQHSHSPVHTPVRVNSLWYHCAYMVGCTCERETDRDRDNSAHQRGNALYGLPLTRGTVYCPLCPMSHLCQAMLMSNASIATTTTIYGLLYQRSMCQWLCTSHICWTRCSRRSPFAHSRYWSCSYSRR